MNAIFLIRHAEKPDGSANGVDITGSSDADSLIPRGWQRAGAWAVFFTSKDGLPAPNRIYAATPLNEKVAPHDKTGSNSKRPVETVTPLADKLGQKLKEGFTKGQESALADEIKALNGITLVCWQHEIIPTIAKLIAGDDAGVPDPWPDDRFDVVWRFQGGSADSWSFDQVCPCLVQGDSSEPLR
jgi:hypothetical protein